MNRTMLAWPRILATVILWLTTTAVDAAEPAAIDILVVAPHSDDEAIGCAVTMMEAVAAGKRVGVVVVSNGDGFPKAAAAVAKKSQDQLIPADYIALTAIRQRHSLSAMTHLGVKSDDLFFLGYPDGLLDEVYAARDDVIVRSRFTSKSETYGAVVPDYHTRTHGRAAPYNRASVVNDLAEIIRARKPKEIYVTHEADPPVPGDHQATFCFVRDAVLAVAWRGELWAYLVHGQGRVSPPEPVRRLALTPEQFAKKRALLERYQVGMSPIHDDLAEKYTRPDELFWKMKLD